MFVRIKETGKNQYLESVENCRVTWGLKKEHSKLRVLAREIFNDWDAVVCLSKIRIFHQTIMVQSER